MIEIKDKKECCGCGACAAICPKGCIEMKRDSEGFAYPDIEMKSCINCGLCDKTCPIINLYEERPFEQKGYVVQHKNLQILKESTAGGAFSAISKYVIDKDGLVFGVALSDTLTAYHTYVDKEEDLQLFRNSKYIQSFLGKNIYDTVKLFLNQGRLVCFSGTPCQIEGLKHYLKKDYENLVLVDVVCRAVPSPFVFKKYIELKQSHLKEKIRKVRFRDKYYGYKYSTMNIITDKNNGNYHQGVESDLWLRAFFSGMCNRPSCYDCKFKKQYRVSDFTIWDCFDVGRFTKKIDSDKGVTRVLIHTQKGRYIFSQISKLLYFEVVKIEKLIAGTAEMKRSVQYNQKREEFMHDAEYMESDALFKKYFPQTCKNQIEHILRLLCYKIGIYGIAKKVYVRLTNKY